MPTNGTDHGERIASLEAGQRALQDEVKKVAGLVAEVSENSQEEHRQTRAEIASLGTKFSQFGKPNYAVLVASISLIVLLGAAAFGPFQLQLSELKTAFSGLTQTVNDHTQLPAHPVAAAILAEREKTENLRFAAVENQLAAQREILELKIQLATKP